MTPLHNNDNKMKYLFQRACLLLSCLFYVSGCISHHDADDFVWKNNQQMILVLSSDWNAKFGVLLRFQYHHHHWVRVGQPISVSLGSKGTAWGIGLYPRAPIPPYKREGDQRSPAGIFELGTSFGYAAQRQYKMPYLALSKDDFCIDNMHSAYYNQIVDRQVVGLSAIKNSTEPMRRDLYLNGDQLYKLGFILRQNNQNIPGYGSCVFVHLRDNVNATTAGCTAMDEGDMKELLLWLKPEFHPVFTLLPVEAYKAKKFMLHLPNVDISNY